MINRIMAHITFTQPHTLLYTVTFVAACLWSVGLCQDPYAVETYELNDGIMGVGAYPIPNHCSEMTRRERDQVTFCVARSLGVFYEGAKKHCSTFECRDGECNADVNARECPESLQYDTCDPEMDAMQNAAQFICSPTGTYQGHRCDPWIMMSCMNEMFEATNERIPRRSSIQDLWSQLKHIEHTLEFLDGLDKMEFCRANVSFATINTCLANKKTLIWGSCSAEAVLPDTSEALRQRFTPWTDTIYDKLQYARRVVVASDYKCNTGCRLCTSLTRSILVPLVLVLCAVRYI